MIRRSLLIALALVVVVRTTHCLYGDALSCARAAEAVWADPPLADPAESDPNESCCLCKGAVLAAPCVIAQPRTESSTEYLAPAHQEPTQVARPAEPAYRRHNLNLPPPARSAALVRALLASWQI